MQNFTKKYLLILLCLPLLVTGCKQIPKLENGEEVIGEVNGKQFTTQELYNSLKEKYGSSALITMIDNYITEQEMTTEIESEAKEAAQTEFDSYKAQYSSNWSSFLSYYGYTTDDQLLADLITSKKQSLVLENYLVTTITDEEIQKYYNESIYGEITARHILITPETTDDMTDEQKTAAKEAALTKAKDLITQLQSSTNLEEDFTKLAKENSDDTGTASEGGLISNFTNDSGLVEEFWKASLELEIGKFTTTPIETEYGYHIIYKVSQNEKPNLEDVKEKVVNSIVSNLLKADNANYIYWAALREKYGMKIHDDTINDAYTATQSKLK